jgi:hypothetical protein
MASYKRTICVLITFLAMTARKHTYPGSGPTTYRTMSNEETKRAQIELQHKIEKSLFAKVLLLSLPNLSYQIIPYNKTVQTGIDTVAKIILMVLYALFSKATQ